MGTYYRRHLAPYWRRDLGFALFLAWLYCTLFGCGLATHDPAIEGTPTQWCLERIWMFSGLTEGLCGAIGLGLSACPRVRALVADPRFAWAAAGVASLGSALVWVAWLERTTLFWQVYAFGGLTCGIGVALFAIVWGARLGTDDEARIELAIPVSFGIAFAIYLVLLLTKWSSGFTLAICVVLCAGSALLACRRVEPDARHSVGTDAMQPDGPETLQVVRECPLVEGVGECVAWPSVRDALSFVVLTVALWFQIAYFRAIATPALMGDSFAHYLYPFAGACVASLVMVALCIRVSRYLNLALAYRWGLPMFMLSYVPLIFGYDDPRLRIVAYAINFLGMFGVQYGCWLGAAKWVRRMGSDPLRAFGALSVGEGLGIFAGCALGLHVVQGLSQERMMAVSLLVMAGVCLAAMMFGFNPDALFRRTRGLARSGMRRGDAPLRANGAATPVGPAAACAPADAAYAACPGMASGG